MANAAVLVEENNKNVWGGGSAPMKASYGKLMMWFFLLSDAFTFSALLITYGLIRFSHPAYAGSVADFQFSQEWWPIPEKVFEGGTISPWHGITSCFCRDYDFYPYPK